MIVEPAVHDELHCSVKAGMGNKTFPLFSVVSTPKILVPGLHLL